MGKCRELLGYELDLITNSDLRTTVELYMDSVPEIFWTAPASSTGKYHPEYSLGSGGLLRHTKAVVKFVVELLNLECYRFFLEEKNNLIASAIIHDSVKHGFNGSAFTVAEHPLLASQAFKEKATEIAYIKPEDIDKICSYVESHMGQWNTEYKSGKEILPKPTTKHQSFLHVCDYLASRRWINVDFNN